MSVKVSTRIWERSTYTRSTLIILLALADFADDDGLSFPSMTTLAAKAHISERQALRIVQRLDAEQAIIYVPGSGRGHRSSYLVLVGLRPSDLYAISERRAKDELFAPFIERVTFAQRKGDICDTERVTFAQRKGDICDTERVTFAQHAEDHSGASPSAETPLSPVMIRHEDPSYDPSYRSTTPLPPGHAAGAAGGGDRELAERLPDGAATWTPSQAHALPSGPRPGAALLAREGFKTPGIREFGDYPPELLAADISRLRAEGARNGGIVAHWRIFPPGTTPAKEAPDAPTQSRPVGSRRGRVPAEAAQPAPHLTERPDAAETERIIAEGLADGERLARRARA